MEFNATFIIAFISFIVFTVIMNIILYKPINDIVQKRKDFIDANYNEAKTNADKTRTILDERKNKLASARQNAKECSEEKINSAKNKKDEITSKAKQSAKENIEKARIENLNSSNEAKEALRGEIKNLAQMISDRFLNHEEKIADIDNTLVDKIMQD